MWRELDRFWIVLLDACVSATLILGFVTPALLVCRQPARRLMLARSALTALLCILPGVGLGLIPKYDLLHAFQATGVLRHPSILAVEPGPPVATVGPLTTAEASHWNAPRSILTGNRLSRSILLFYLAGVALGLARFGLGWGVLWSVKRRSWEPSPETLAVYESLPYRDGRTKPRLRIVSRLRRPVLVGLWSPVILIPHELDLPEASPRELRLSLLHELAHAEGADPWYGFFANLSLVVWFFLPPIWWVWSRMRLDQEFVADRRASIGFGKGREYAAALLGMAVRSLPFEPNETEPASNAHDHDTDPRTPAGRPLKFAATEEASPVFQRVSMLLRCPFPIETRPPLFWVWGSILAVAFLTVFAASLSVRPTLNTPAQHPVHTFRMARLDLEAAPTGPTGRAPLFELPVRLPETFDLTVDVWSNRPGLSKSRVAGLRLLPAVAEFDVAELAKSAANWHSVRIKRDAKAIEVWVDGRRSPLNDEALCPTAWLSVEPASGSEGFYQNLILTW